MANRPYYYYSELSKSSTTVSPRLSGLNEYQRILGSGTVSWALIGTKSLTRLLIGQNDQYPVYLGS